MFPPNAVMYCKVKQSSLFTQVGWTKLEMLVYSQTLHISYNISWSGFNALLKGTSAVGGNSNVPVQGFELATFRHQERSPNRSATAAQRQNDGIIN